MGWPSSFPLLCLLFVPLCSTFSPPPFFFRLKVLLSQSLPHALTPFLCASVIRLSLLWRGNFSFSCDTFFSASSIVAFFLHQISSLQLSCLLLFSVLLSSFISSILQSTSTFVLFLSLILLSISSHLSPPPAVVEDDKPPYTILCAQAALHKSYSVEWWEVGAGWGPQRNEFNLNYSSWNPQLCVCVGSLVSVGLCVHVHACVCRRDGGGWGQKCRARAMWIILD